MKGVVTQHVQIWYAQSTKGLSSFQKKNSRRAGTRCEHRAKTAGATCGVTLSRISSSSSVNWNSNFPSVWTQRAKPTGSPDPCSRSIIPTRSSTPSSYVKVGSYGKGTATRPRTDLDMLFVLPWDVYTRIEALTGNKQSQLLQEVRRTLLVTFPNTEIAADGQAVVAPFQTYNVDIVPGISLHRWRLRWPVSDRGQHGWRTVALVQSGGRVQLPAGRWTRYRPGRRRTSSRCSRRGSASATWRSNPSASRLLATVFVTQWEHRHQTIFYYDWMIRDFFAFMLNYVNGWARPAGITEQILLGDCWESKCRTAYSRALKACDYERADDDIAAASEWQKIFGSQFHVNWMRHLLLAGVGA